MKKIFIILIFLVVYSGIKYFQVNKNLNAESKSPPVIASVPDIKPRVEKVVENVAVNDVVATTSEKVVGESFEDKLTNIVVQKKSETSEVVIKSSSSPKPVEIKEEFTVRTQLISGIITFDYGLQPETYTVKANVPVRFEINPKDDGEGCMSTIMIPELYNEPFLIRAGEKIIMEFVPKQIGTYEITCAMGVPWGEIRVIN